jgi:hypothetical protein
VALPIYEESLAEAAAAILSALGDKLPVTLNPFTIYLF